MLVDTGPILALLSRNDARHHECTETFKTLAPPLFTSWPVLVEATYMLRAAPHLIQALFRSFHRGLYEILDVPENGMPAIAKLLNKYADQQIDLADATLIYLADTHEIQTVFTLDSDFHIYRYKKRRTFNVIP